MQKNKDKVTACEDFDFTKEYNNIFLILGINVDQISHEWNKNGDLIKEFNLFENHPTPIITLNTQSINY